MRGIQFINPHTEMDFIKKRWVFFIIGLFISLGALGGLAVKGLKYGIDFEGGIMLEIRTPGPANLEELRTQMKSLNMGEATIQSLGSERDVMIRIEKQKGGDGAQNQAIERIKTALGTEVEYRGVQTVGPTIGHELVYKGILATLWAIIAMMIYITWRFEWQFGIGAIVALVHDCLFVLGFYVVSGSEFGTNSIVALLTTLGYSINDTVVVYDRIRENLGKFKKASLQEIINRSINETLSRTILTSVTTLISLLALYFFGGPVIASYSLPIMCGIGIGTFSSICIASPLLLYIPLKDKVSFEVVKKTTKS
jgi:preprotein translocase SecF subunit